MRSTIFVIAASALVYACATSGSVEDEASSGASTDADGGGKMPLGQDKADSGGSASVVSCVTDADCPSSETCVPAEGGELGGKVCVLVAGDSDTSTDAATVVDAGADADAAVVSYAYGAWSSWGACSAACAPGGTQGRTRECKRNDGVTVACSFCGGDCSDSQVCNTQTCGWCPSQQLTVPTANQGFCTGTLPASAPGPGTVANSGPATLGFTGTACKVGNVQGSHSGTLTGATFGTCAYYCDVIATCDATGAWTNLTYSW